MTDFFEKLKAIQQESNKEDKAFQVVNDKNLDEIVKISKIISKNDPLVVEDVQFCIKDYKSYFEENKEEFLERNLDFNINKKNICWLCLADKLIENQYAMEMQWNAEPKDVVNKVKRILSKSNIEANFFDILFKNEMNTLDILKMINDELLSEAYTLSSIDINNDNYVLIITTIDEYEEIASLANVIGKSIYNEFYC